MLGFGEKRNQGGLNTPLVHFKGFTRLMDPPPGAGPEYYLQNYRLGRTLGIGSFGKVQLMVVRGAAVWIEIEGWMGLNACQEMSVGQVS